MKFTVKNELNLLIILKKQLRKCLVSKILLRSAHNLLLEARPLPAVQLALVASRLSAARLPLVANQLSEVACNSKTLLAAFKVIVLFNRSCPLTNLTKNCNFNAKIQSQPSSLALKTSPTNS